MDNSLNDALAAFAADYRFNTKGKLSVALVVTQHARNKGLPLDPESLLTPQGGQVSGLGVANVQSILERHGIRRILAKEGGRTNRGSIQNTRDYVSLFNDFHEKRIVDLDAIEAFWIGKVLAFFAGKPFKIQLDPSKGLQVVVRNLIRQAGERQKSHPGYQYAGAVFQHLVGAKLDCILEPDRVAHHSFSTADEQSGRAGDFVTGDVAIHVTTSPSEAVIDRCKENLDDGLHPLLVTGQRGYEVAGFNAEAKGIRDRLDIFEIEQFLATNLHELGQFAADGRKTTIADLVKKYNRIVDEVETDPGLKIDLKS